MFKIATPTGIETHTINNISFTTWEEELQSYPSKFKQKHSITLFGDFRNFLETWASCKENGFLKNFLIEGSKLAVQARNGDLPLETLLFYIQTLQTIVSKK